MTGRDDLSAAHAEASVLGAVLIGGDIDVARTTLPQPTDTHGWTVEGHWTVWAAILAVAERGDVPDTVAVAQQLMDGGTIDRVGGPAGVAALASSAPAPSSVGWWASTVADRAHRRRMTAAAQDVIAACADLDRDPAGAVVALDGILDDAPTQGGLQLITGDRLHLLPDPEWLVDGKITRGLTVIWGQPKSGKSFVALDLAAARAAGSDWHGMTVRPGRTIYVAGEGMHDAKSRLGQAFDVYGADVTSRAAVAVTAEPIDLTSHRDLARLDAACGDHDADLLVLDTWARVSGVSDENDNAEASSVIAALDRMRHRHDLDVIVVHHARKDGLEMRGASALLAALDTAVRVTKDGHDVEAWASDIRGGPEWHRRVRWRLHESGDSAVLRLTSDRDTDADADANVAEVLATLTSGTVLTHAQVRQTYNGDVLRRIKQHVEVVNGHDDRGRPNLTGKIQGPM